jgi:hypothetical protein
MNNKFLVLGVAAVSLATFTVGCNKQEVAAPTASPEVAKALDPSAADALRAAEVKKAAVADTASEDLKAADAQKEREAIAQKQAADKADQALKEADATKLAAEQTAVAQQAQLAAGTNKVQALIDSAKTLSGENKWAEVLKILAQLAEEKLSPAQQTAVNELKSYAQKQTEAAMARKATTEAGKALGSFLEPKK